MDSDIIRAVGGYLHGSGKLLLLALFEDDVSDLSDGFELRRIGALTESHLKSVAGVLGIARQTTPIAEGYRVD